MLEPDYEKVLPKTFANSDALFAIIRPRIAYRGLATLCEPYAHLVPAPRLAAADYFLDHDLLTVGSSSFVSARVKEVLEREGAEAEFIEAELGTLAARARGLRSWMVHPTLAVPGLIDVERSKVRWFTGTNQLSGITSRKIRTIDHLVVPEGAKPLDPLICLAELTRFLLVSDRLAAALLKLGANGFVLIEPKNLNRDRYWMKRTSDGGLTSATPGLYD